MELGSHIELVARQGAYYKMLHYSHAQEEVEQPLLEESIAHDCPSDEVASLAVKFLVDEV